MASTSSSTEFLVEEEPERQYLQRPLFASTTSSKTSILGGGGSSGSGSGNNKKLNYGSLRKETEHTATVFMVNYKHQLKSGETMQGISLRYGVPIESIKKANRLWSNDLAFVKDVLLIPMSRDRLVEQGLDETQTESVNQSMLSRSSSSQVVDQQSPTTSLSSRASLADDSNGGSQFKDYLSKYDTVITESRQKLKTLESSSNLKNGKSYTIKNGKNGDYNNNYEENNNDDDDLFQLGKKLSLASSSQHASSSGSITPSNSASLFDTPDLVIITNNDANSSSSRSSKASFYNGSGSSSNLSSGGTQLTSSSRARLAQENLQRLEREKDDLYEL